MLKSVFLSLILFLLVNLCIAQKDSTAVNTGSTIFDRVAKEIKAFQLDTTAAPNDKVTRKILELRSLRGGFNINEAIEFKLEEDKQKGEVPKAELERLAAYFRSGEGKRLLDNAVNWIYRRRFTYGELKQMVKFYKTSAGQKMATDFPVIMLQSLQAAEIIKENFTKQQKKL